MSRYFDTGLLVKLYVPESNTPAVLAVVRASDEALACTPLHDLELKNSLRAKLYRKEITLSQANGAIAAFESDVDHGVLVRLPYEWDQVHRRAESLSARFTPRTGCRTLDILHVAAALELKSARFFTTDQRQAKLAELAGLRVVSV